MMKALILAAGFGTRLRPHTNHIPKPLFPVMGEPLLDRLIIQLRSAGCEAIAVNTHHLHQKIEAHLAGRSYDIPVVTRYEPDILGTGGAIRNLTDFWDDRPFMVVNSDILTNIDFKAVYQYHIESKAPATLALVDAPPLNSVTVDRDTFVSGFLSPSDPIPDELYTFTGIQVIDPKVLRLIPPHGFYSSIDAYRHLIRQNTPPAGFIAQPGQWQDLGTPERYMVASRDAVAVDAFRHAFGASSSSPFKWNLLAGDGSDRKWYRVEADNHSLVAADHGLTAFREVSEVKSFVAIGQHLSRHRLPVPEIYGYDLFSGWVLMEDAGDLHLQTAVKNAGTPGEVEALYRMVLDALIRFSQDGIEDFDTDWTCQSAAYDRALIMSHECDYFMNAFLDGYLGLQLDPAEFLPAFNALADGAVSGGFDGLMHRDFQSRNIMIKGGLPTIIDFQGARRGPVQYDIASLLIDPYTALPESLQETLYEYALSELSRRVAFDSAAFRNGYLFCRVTRNLQMLGAFGHLTKVKQKPWFEQYIPPALDSLKRNLAKIVLPEVSKLQKILEEISPNQY
jgi:aminoglycoside/choline kinase family phosphotransferase/dTDP-glucose pyrophosphorylase